MAEDRLSHENRRTNEDRHTNQNRHSNDGRGAAGLQANFRALIGVAMVEAANRGAPLVEAEHLLLGFLFDRTGTATAVLGREGLSYAAFDQALEEERKQTLAAVGVTLPEPDRLKAAPRSRLGRPRFGASAKDAWHRAAASRGPGRSRRFFDIDLMLGILAAELGTVPRALARAGFDRQQLIAALQEARS